MAGTARARAGPVLGARPAAHVGASSRAALYDVDGGADDRERRAERPRGAAVLRLGQLSRSASALSRARAVGLDVPAGGYAAGAPGGRRASRDAAALPEDAGARS